MNKEISYFKKALIMLMAVMMVFTMMPSMAWADGGTATDGSESITTVAQGNCGYDYGDGDNTALTWSLTNDGVLKIEGDDYMADFEWSNPKNTPGWEQYKDQIKKVIIGEDVWSIGAKAFYGCTQIEQLMMLEESSPTIGAEAFANCTALQTVTFSEGQEIGNRAFAGCIALTEITLPANLYMGEGVFSDCSGLFKATVHSWENGIFENCTSLREVTTSVVTDNMFNGFTALEKVKIEDGIKKLADNMFQGCEHLKEVVVPASIKDLGTGNDVIKNLLSGEGKNNLPLIEENGATYSSDKRVLLSVSTDETNFIIPDSVEIIGPDCFEKNTSLTTIALSNNVEKIGEGAFKNCTALTSITIPNSIKEIPNSAFSGCTALTEVNFAVGLTGIGNSAFQNCSSLETFIIPNTVESIGTYAFNNVGITEIEIPESVTDFGGGYNFSECKKLETALLPNSLTTLPSAMFWKCEKLNYVKLPENLTVISNLAFSGCSNLPAIELPNSLSKIGGQAFENCNALQSITIPNNVIEIGSCAFYFCNKLRTITLPDGLTKIEEGVFWEDKNNNGGIESVVIPATVKTIDYNNFLPIASLKTIYFKGGPTEWNNITWNLKSMFKGSIVYYYGNEHSEENAPVITEQPKSSSFVKDEDATKALSVTVQQPAEGETIQFYWYKNSTESTINGTLVGNSDSTSGLTSTYTPSTDTIGNTYYYCCIVKVGNDGKAAAKYTDIVCISVKNDTFKGSGSQNDPYQLSDLTDLMKLDELIMAGQSTEGIYFKLMDDITLPLDWKPIGGIEGEDIASDANVRPFSGIFDGDNHTVTVAERGLPLFNYVREATVKDLNIYGKDIASDGLVANYIVDYGADGNYNVGTGGSYTPGCPDTIDIIDCTIKAGTSIRGTGFIAGHGAGSGGNTVNLLRCKVEKNVKIGWNFTANKNEGNNGIGSFVGSLNGTIVDCVSYADVYGGNRIGGLAGGKGQSMGLFRIRNSSFHGTVNATGNLAGGIAASGYWSDSAPNTPGVSIENCYVTGNVTAGSKAGGILGGDDGMWQCWGNAYIRNNHFVGKVKATEKDGCAGAIIGYMPALNKYNVITNNYFLEGCGASSAIGKVDGIDTSNAKYATDGTVSKGFVDGTYYFDSSKDDLKYVNKALDPWPNDQYNVIINKNHNRTDDPLGKDVETLGKAMTKAQFADGTVGKLLNKGSGSLKNWDDGKEYGYPVPTDKVYAMELNISGEYKTKYYVGESLDMSGAVFEVVWSDGTITQVPKDQITFSGFDSSKRAGIVVTAEYGAATGEIYLQILKRPDASGESNTIKVHFTMLGDKNHGEPTDATGTHTLKSNNLDTWISEITYTVDMNATVWDVIQRALKENQMTCTATQSLGTVYIESVTHPKEGKISEFTNGNFSGWMYTLNGHHSELGVAQQYLENNDRIIFHYTDDYTVEEGSEKWNTPGAGVIEEVKDVTTDTKTGTTTAPTEVKLTEKVNADGTKTKVAEVKVSADNQKEILKQAKANKSKEIILNVATKAVGEAAKADVTLDKSFIDSIVKDTDAKLTVKTPFGDKTYTQDELKAMSAAATGSTVTIAVEKVAEEPEVDVKALTAKLTPVARSVKTAKKNVKVTVSLDKQDKEILSQLTEAGYTVKYRFYRSTKKSAGFKSTVTKKTASYTNTSGKKGTKYFYKVQVRVYDEKGKLVARTALKQCKYASRTWTR